MRSTYIFVELSDAGAALLAGNSDSAIENARFQSGLTTRDVVDSDRCSGPLRAVLQSAGMRSAAACDWVCIGGPQDGLNGIERLMLALDKRGSREQKLLQALVKIWRWLAKLGMFSWFFNFNFNLCHPNFDTRRET